MPGDRSAPKPKPIRIGSLVFPVHRSGGRWALYYYLGGRRKLTAATYGALAIKADKIAKALSCGRAYLRKMTPEDARELLRARDALAKAGIAEPLDGAARLLASLATEAGGIAELAKAAKWVRGSASGELAGASLREMVEALLAAKTAAGRSAVYLRTLSGDLRAFACEVGQRHPGWPGRLNPSHADRDWPAVPLAEISPSAIDRWLASKPVGGRRRANLRDKVVMLFNWLQGRGAMPRGPHAAHAVDKPATSKRPPEAYSADQIRALLEAAAAGVWRKCQTRHPEADRHLQIIAIRAFAGVRLAEVERLTRQDFRLGAEPTIIVPDAKAKAAGRAIPIRPNLLRWLLRYPLPATGPIRAGENFAHTLARIAKAAGVEVIPNGLRDSFISYRVAETGGELQTVAFEAGNSPGEIKRSYLQLVSKSEAARYFAVAPSERANVVEFRA